MKKFLKSYGFSTVGSLFLALGCLSLFLDKTEPTIGFFVLGLFVFILYLQNLIGRLLDLFESQTEFNKKIMKVLEEMKEKSK